MARTYVLPDTNCFIDHPDIGGFLARRLAPLNVVLLTTVLVELDNHRRQRQADRRRTRVGEAAARAIESIKGLQEHPEQGLELDVYAPGGLADFPSNDFQIVDELFSFARTVDPRSRVIFVTNDGALPAILFNHRRRELKLGNVQLLTSAGLTTELPFLNGPTVSILGVRLAQPNNVRVDSLATALSLSFAAEAARGTTLGFRLDVRPTGRGRALRKEYRFDLAGDRRLRQATININLSAAECGFTVNRRYGVQNCDLAVSIIDHATANILTMDNRYLLRYALREFSLTMQAPPTAASSPATLASVLRSASAS